MSPGMTPLIDLPKWMQDQELIWIKKALQITDGNQSDAAKLLGLNRTTLVEKMRKHKILKPAKR